MQETAEEQPPPGGKVGALADKERPLELEALVQASGCKHSSQVGEFVTFVLDKCKG